MLSSLDVVPTVVAAVGGKLPNDRTFDGADLLPILAGKKPSHHRALHWTWNQSKEERWQAMRKDDWKIVRRSEQVPWELYDLSKDIGESKNLASTKTELVTELSAEFQRRHEETLK